MKLSAAGAAGVALGCRPSAAPTTHWFTQGYIVTSSFVRSDGMVVVTEGELVHLGWFPDPVPYRDDLDDSALGPDWLGDNPRDMIPIYPAHDWNRKPVGLVLPNDPGGPRVRFYGERFLDLTQAQREDLWQCLGRRLEVEVHRMT